MPSRWVCVCWMDKDVLFSLDDNGIGAWWIVLCQCIASDAERLSQIYLIAWIHGLRYQYIIYFCVNFSIHTNNNNIGFRKQFSSFRKVSNFFLVFHQFFSFVDCCAPLLTYLLEIWKFVAKLFFFTDFFFSVCFIRIVCCHAEQWSCFCHYNCVLLCSVIKQNEREEKCSLSN